jgi:uncharacterized oligopeptide transporter (OPT) family protein
MRKLRLGARKRTILVAVLGIMIGVAVGSSSLPFLLQPVVIVIVAVLMVIIIRKVTVLPVPLTEKEKTLMNVLHGKVEEDEQQ